jgi:hypothetical protein
MARADSSRFRRSLILAAVAACAGLVAPAGALGVHGGDREVTVGSSDAFFSGNKQNEPAVAVDANHPNVQAAGANDNIDMELCNAGDDTTCPFTPDVGATGISFSFNSGDSWTQPTYTGSTGRHCVGQPGPDPGCQPAQGPIGTVPRYDEVGLASDGDPALAFGPRPGPGGFSWSNGSRLYVANLAASLAASPGEPAFKGFEAIAVSRTDDPQSAAAGSKAAWRVPVIISKQSSATFADKEQIWADNASSSRFFGHVYVCYASFTGNGAAPIVVARSTNGGDTWSTQHVSPASAVSKKHFGRSGCTIRTDSAGVVYVFYEEFSNPDVLPPTGIHTMVKSFDGGRSFGKEQPLFTVTDPCFVIDPVIGRCVEDGLAGARNDLAASPSVDIANGAPTGGDASNLIVDSWADGRDGLNNERVLFSWSRAGAAPGTWAAPQRIQDAGDRGYYAAPALSPDGRDVYVVYNAFRTPFQSTTATPRSLVGVVKHADFGTTGGPGAFATLHRGASGDPRGSSQNDLQAEFLGDYVYAIATRGYGAAVWNDVRGAADCPAVDAWRQSLRDGTTVPRPAPQQDCPPTFGNSDIFGGSWADPSSP